jgi:hypothetical protein
MSFVFKFPDGKFAGQIVLYRTRRLTSHSDPFLFFIRRYLLRFYLPLGAGREELVQPVQVASSATGAPVRDPRSLAAYINTLYSVN